MQDNNLVSGEEKASVISKSASIVIKKGESRNIMGDYTRKEKRKDFKDEGGIYGGHAMFNTTDGYLSFSGPAEEKQFNEEGRLVNSYFANRSSDIIGRYKNSLLVEFPLDLTISQYFNLISQYQDSDGNIKVPLYNYKVFGYRCASSLLSVASNVGIVDVSSKNGHLLHAVNPNALVRYLQRKGLKNIVYTGNGGLLKSTNYNTNFKFDNTKIIYNYE